MSLRRFRNNYLQLCIHLRRRLPQVCRFRTSYSRLSIQRRRRQLHRLHTNYLQPYIRLLRWSFHTAPDWLHMSLRQRRLLFRTNYFLLYILRCRFQPSQPPPLPLRKPHRIRPLLRPTLELRTSYLTLCILQQHP